jgi:glycosyltransferase involved in cell wall biosynthesis
MEKPLVTVITPAFNCSNLIVEAVESVRNQTFSFWEHLIVDDGSTDGTDHVVEGLVVRDRRTRLIRQPTNQGPAAARNRAIELAQGRYLAFLDSDDLWFPEKLQKQLEFMDRTGAALSYTNYEKIHELDSTVIGHVQSPERIGERDLLRSNQIACSTAMYDSYKTGRVFMPLIRKRQDWGLWLRIARMGHYGLNVGETLARYRVRSNSISANKFSAMAYNWRFFRDVAEMPFWERVYRIVSYAAIASWKYRQARRNRPSIPVKQ